MKSSWAAQAGSCWRTNLQQVQQVRPHDGTACLSRSVAQWTQPPGCSSTLANTKQFALLSVGFLLAPCSWASCLVGMADFLFFFL